jgi:hypothetical protein
MRRAGSCGPGMRWQLILLDRSPHVPRAQEPGRGAVGRERDRHGHGGDIGVPGGWKVGRLTGSGASPFFYRVTKSGWKASPAPGLV